MAPSAKAVEDGVDKCLSGLGWLATTSECSSPKVVTGTHALLRGVAADEKPAHSSLFAGPPLVRNGKFAPAHTERQGQSTVADLGNPILAENFGHRSRSHPPTRTLLCVCTV